MLVSSIIDDWRYRHEKDKILTFLYVMRYIGGEPKAQDDIKFVKWARFDEISEGDIMPMHRPLLSMLNDYFKGEILRLTERCCNGEIEPCNCAMH